MDTNNPIWVATEKEANKAIAEISAYKVAGLDTEFEGVDIGNESCVGKARIHVFSIATPSGPLLPRGVNEATSYVFSAECLTIPIIKEWIENADIIKAVHNQPVDSHALRNSGVVLRGARNTLAMARWWWPHRAKYEGFGLDALGRDFLGSGKADDFDELFDYDDTETRQQLVTKNRCSCGELGCRKRRPSPDGTAHDVKTPEKVMQDVERKVRRHISLFSLHPDHYLWERYLNYAAWDAVLALWLYQLMIREGTKERPYPWQILI